VEKQLCGPLVAAAAAMSEHSCSAAVSLLRVCCKCAQLFSPQTVQQLQTSTICQRLTTMLKISSIQRGPQHVNAAAFESLRMYCSMLLVSLASELGEAVLQVARFMSACPVPLLTAAAASPDAQQHSSHLRSDQR
jgi:hypothetical protein